MTGPQALYTTIGLGTALIFLAVLLSPWVRRSQLWTITVTPLA